MTTHMRPALQPSDWTYCEGVVIPHDYTHGVQAAPITALRKGCDSLHRRICDDAPDLAFGDAVAAIGYTVHVRRTITRYDGPDNSTTVVTAVMHYGDFRLYGAPVGWSRVGVSSGPSQWTRHSDDQWTGAVGRDRETQTLAQLGGGAD